MKNWLKAQWHGLLRFHRIMEIECTDGSTLYRCYDCRWVP